MQSKIPLFRGVANLRSKHLKYRFILQGDPSHSAAKTRFSLYFGDSRPREPPPETVGERRVRALNAAGKGSRSHFEIQPADRSLRPFELLDCGLQEARRLAAGDRAINESQRQRQEAMRDKPRATDAVPADLHARLSRHAGT